MYIYASQLCRNLNIKTLLLVFSIKSKRQLSYQMNNVYLLETAALFQISYNAEMFVNSVKSLSIVEVIPVNVLERSAARNRVALRDLANADDQQLLSQRIDVAGRRPGVFNEKIGPILRFCL